MWRRSANRRSSRVLTGQIISCTLDFYNRILERTSPEFMEGVIFQFPDFDDPKLNEEQINFPRPNDFYAEYVERFGADNWSAVSWEYASIMELWMDAAQRAGSAEPDAVQAAMMEGGVGKHIFGDVALVGQGALRHRQRAGRRLARRGDPQRQGDHRRVSLDPRLVGQVQRAADQAHDRPRPDVGPAHLKLGTAAPLSHRGRGCADGDEHAPRRAAGAQPMRVPTARFACPGPLSAADGPALALTIRERDAPGQMTDLLIQTTVNAAYAASYMALVAVGLVLIFGVMGVINFAHGELYMAGAYSVVYLYAGLEPALPRRGRGRNGLRRLPRAPDGDGPVPAAAGESARRAHRLDRLSPDPPVACGAGFRPAHAERAACLAQLNRPCSGL